MASEKVGGGRMLAVERRQRILDMLVETSSVRVSDICAACEVSAVTARGDLDYLEGEGLLRRTHGGAVAISDYVSVRPSEQDRRALYARQAIGRYAAGLVSDGETILVGSGTTTLELVRALRSHRGVTVVSNDVVVLELAARALPEVTVVATGGEFNRERLHLHGPLLAASLSGFLFDKVFLGADGFEPGLGFLAELETTASAKVEFLAHARRRVILMDATKVGRGFSAMRFARPDEVDVVVMDVDPGGVVAAACNAGERSVEVVEVRSPVTPGAK